MELSNPHCSRRSGRIAAAFLSAFLACGIGGCATYQRCGFAGCPGDASITAAIESDLHANKAIQDWNIHVQTFDRIVYLYGIVDTNVERSFIVATANEAPGVRRVGDSIAIRGNGW